MALAVNTFEINVNRAAKVVNVTVGDQMDLEVAQKFVTEYKSKTSAINVNEYTLDINCIDMKVLSPEMADDLSGVFALYKETGFNKVVFTTKKNPILNMQLGRLGRKTGLTNMEIVEL